MTSEIITRPAELGDAVAIADLLIERKYDATPHMDVHNEERLAWWREHGQAHNIVEIQRTIDDPAKYFLRVAAIGSVVVGYLKATSCAESPHVAGGPFTYAQGLMVAKNHEAQGVGGRLAIDFCRWAAPLEQDIYIEVTTGNDHARMIYESHGCEYITSVPATQDAPPLDILVLPYQQMVELSQNM
ncbi:MAG TPA: GNAT family N-acetyltransferase [Candidatus Saccharimonadales bacterium]|nr:GNAT family N-acetyltransferase [Candidatus Saccharimonadales bacterium]